MDQKEYLKNRFKRDFLQYCLLQEDSRSAKELADALYAIIDLDGFAAQCKQDIESLCDKYLSFEKVKTDGKLSNELSQELSLEVKDKIMAEYQAALIVNSNGLIDVLLSQIECNVERLAWSNGVVNMQEAIRMLVDRLHSASQNYISLKTTPLSEATLLDKFNNAANTTLLERIQGNNVDDVIEYRNALIEYVQVVGKNMLYDQLSEIYHSFAEAETFVRLQSNFEYLLKYSETLKNSIVEVEANEAWDKEYNRLVPTDFYSRNVENITAEHAFQMILFQFFAKNEDWMIDNGLLVDGELRVYAGKNIKLIDDLYCLIKDYIL